MTMPSPVTEPDGDDPAILINQPPPDKEQADTPARANIRRWIWLICGVIVAIPLLLTLAGALTSPPHVKGFPVGHLIFLEADQPSEHTTILRGMRIMGPDGSSHQLLHETEPQDTDGGNREWITQPQASPDGRWLAFEKQIITLQEEKQSIDNQLWVMPLSAPNPPPRMLLDLTAQHLKQFVGLAWTGDSKRVIFLNDCLQYEVDAVSATASSTKAPLSGCSPQPSGATISTARHPSTPASDLFAFDTVTPSGATIQVHSPSGDTVFSYPHRQTPVWALSAEGQLAVAPDSGQPEIEIKDTAHHAATQRLTARWGWSVYGRRHITAMKWSPDGKYLAYSVSKPPFEDELFYLDPATGQCSQMPVRTGQDGWDWTP